MAAFAANLDPNLTLPKSNPLGPEWLCCRTRWHTAPPRCWCLRRVSARLSTPDTRARFAIAPSTLRGRAWAATWPLPSGGARYPQGGRREGLPWAWGPNGVCPVGGHAARRQSHPCKQGGGHAVLTDAEASVGIGLCLPGGRRAEFESHPCMQSGELISSVCT